MREWTCGFVMAVGLVAIPNTAPAQTQPGEPAGTEIGHVRSNHPALRAIATNKPITIVLLLVNEADVPSHVLSQAQDEASRIYQGHRIRLVWTHPDTERGDYRFTVKILPRALTGKGVDGRAMGVAPGTRERRGTLAYAFYDRIKEVTITIGADAGLILGHVMAHEIGHLLLPHNSHAKTGLMRGGWDTQQAMRAATGALTFTPKEAALILERLQNLSELTAHR